MSKKMFRRMLMTNEEIGDEEKIKEIRLWSLENASTALEQTIAVHMAKYGTY